MELAVEQLKVCRVCGATEPSGFYDSTRTLCKRCAILLSRHYRAKRSANNKELYGTIYPPEQMVKRREYMRLKRIRRRTQALSLIGDKCECCGESNPEWLAFDHIHGGGRRSGKGGSITVEHILKMDSPSSTYQTLCHNCNSAISTFGYCPHQGRPVEEPANRTLEPVRNRKLLRRTHKIEFVTEYGGKCQVCGENNWEFLTVDHINNGGTEHRDKIRKGGIHFYRWLKLQGYPKNEYQLLCFNCNTVKEITRRASKCLS